MHEASSPAKSRARSATSQQRLLTGQQAEQTYGIPYRSIYDLAMRGVLPIVRFPGSRRLWFDRADMERLVERSKEVVGR